MRAERRQGLASGRCCRALPSAACAHAVLALSATHAVLAAAVCGIDSPVIVTCFATLQKACRHERRAQAAHHAPQPALGPEGTRACGLLCSVPAC